MRWVMIFLKLMKNYILKVTKNVRGIMYFFITYFQRQGIDISDTDRQSANISDSEMIKVEKPTESDGENPFGGDDYDDEEEDEWQSN